MKKINIGAGINWYCKDWDVLDNGPSDYNFKWKHKGKCWESGLPSGDYDIVFCSHMLEHIPHFRIEKTIAEFNRIMKTGGTLRILVPSLKKAAEAYVNNDVSFFNTSKHYSDHLGIGGSFLRVMISPGNQTLAISREMDEILGGYAHLYSFDFVMMKILLEKWGYTNIKESKPGESSIDELKIFQHLSSNSKIYDMNDEYVTKKQYLKENAEWYFSGFDKTSKKQLVVEAIKEKDVPYNYENEFKFNRTGRIDSRLENLKLSIFRYISNFIDFTYLLYKKIK